MDRLKQLLAIVLLIAAPYASSQSSNAKKITPNTGETIFIHTNASIFITGETLYCKLYCLNPEDKSPSKISQIAYAELIDSNRKSVSKQKLNLENGMAQGDFFIPTTLKTGNYKLIAYTQWMLSASGTNFFAIDISVVNPFQPLENSLKNQSLPTTEVSTNQASSDKILLLETDKKSYSAREKATLKIKNPAGAQGNFSVSVRKAEAISAVRPAAANAFQPASTFFNGILNRGQLPELRGELISGSVVSKKDKKFLGNITVALSIPGKSYAFKIVKTDASGKFVFVLDPSPSGASAVIQVMESNRDEFSLLLDEPKTPNLTALQFGPELSLTTDLKTEIEERSVANQIENAYYETKKDSVEPMAPADSFFRATGKRYILDEYTRFPTLRETITEVVLEMYTQKSGGKSSIHLRNNTMDPEIYGQPLILVDGLLIQDTNELYDYNPENIYAIDLVNYPYVYGPRTFSGVANIITKNFDYEMKASGDFIKKTDLARPSLHKQYFNPSYAAGNAFDRIPDYRHQLLWQPQVILNGKESTVDFYTSDISGKYEVVLEGFTQSGIPVSTSDFIEVK